MVVSFELSQVRVLIVDDTALMRTHHKNNLIALGIREGNIFQAEDGKSALITLAKVMNKNHSVQLIICDWNMPHVSGLEVLKTIKKVPSTQTIPFIMVTCVSDKEDIKSALKLGVHSYILKPINDENYRDKVIEALSLEFLTH